ncbi:putative FHA domain-containing protein [Gammaproteobacteria bacterium]
MGDSLSTHPVMAEYVRICPRCKFQNPEHDDVCNSCRQFIGLEDPTPAPKKVSPPAAEVTPKPTVLVQVVETPAELKKIPETKRYVEPALFLEAGGLLLAVRSGHRLGQKHSKNDAEIQLPKTLAGSEFVHRQHCCFEHDGTRWYVTAIDQKPLGRNFTNPTFLNGRVVSPGTKAALTNGDELKLSGVVLYIHTPEGAKG